MSSNPVTHAQQIAKTRPATPCNGWHSAFGGGCMNCGWEGPDPAKVVPFTPSTRRAWLLEMRDRAFGGSK